MERTRHALAEVTSRQLADLRLAVMMIVALDLKDRMMIVALGITMEGVKIPLGLWEGSTENATVATALLSNVLGRGLDPEQRMLFVLDGSKALRMAVRTVFGEVPFQRSVRHTRSGMRSDTWPNGIARQSSRGCVAPGRRPTKTARSTQPGSRAS